MGGSKKVVVGFKYFMGFHLVLCHGEVDSLLEARYADRELWSGVQSGSGAVTVDKPDLLGGTKSEGGVSGVFNFLSGESSQMENAYLKGILGGAIPAYRGVASIVAEQPYYAAMNHYLKDFVWRLSRLYAREEAWYPGKVSIDGHMNPAHILVDCLTNSAWGAGLSLNDIHEPSFEAAADVLVTEGFGLSMIYRSQGSVFSFISDVIKYIEAALYIGPTDGKYHLDLLRKTADPGLLLSYTEDDLVEVLRVEAAVLADGINEVIVTYTDDATGKPRATSPIQNLGAIQSQGKTVSKKVDYPAIHSETLAAAVGRRDLHSASYPLRSAAILMSRKRGWGLVPGQPIVLDLPEYGAPSTVFRVMSIEGGTLDNPVLEITLLEDALGTELADYYPPQDYLFTPPNTTPTDLANWHPVEAPYYQLINYMSEADFTVFDPLGGIATFVAARENAAWTGYSAMTSQSSSASFPSPQDVAGDDAFCPFAKVAGGYAHMDSSISYSDDFDVNGAGLYGVEGVQPGDAGYFFNSDTEFEMFSVITIDAAAREMTVKRGILDTVPKRLTSATQIFFVEQGIGNDDSDGVDSEYHYYRLMPESLSGTLDYTDATSKRMDFDARAYRPFPPAWVHIDGVGSPFDGIDVYGDFSVHYRVRDRTTAISTYYDYGLNTSSWEAGMTVTVKIYNDDTEALLYSATGITDQYTASITTLPDGVYPIRIELSSQRDGYDSMQKYDGVYRYIKGSAMVVDLVGSSTLTGTLS